MDFLSELLIAAIPLWSTDKMARGRRTKGNTSATFRIAGIEALRRHNAMRHVLPVCGAKRKRDGLPCENTPMENGRCYLHGGRTPKGDQWHTTQWPNGKAPDAIRRMQRKLRDLERRRKARETRIAQMSPEERERHERWHRSHKPGAAAERERRRIDRQNAEAWRAAAERPARPPSPEAEELQKKIKALKLELARLSGKYS